jgi:SAM-dependent methyltransferase
MADGLNGEVHVRERVRSLVERVPHWCRVVMEREIDAALRALPVSQLDAIEVSGNRRGRLGFRSYKSTSFPEFDICSDGPITAVADVVFCEQVLEHVRHPTRAARNLWRLLRPGGLAIVSVPFMIRIHREPEDYWRFSPAGLEALLEDAGFQVEQVRSWGNRPSVLSNLWFWFPYIPFLNPLRDNPEVPQVVWAFARRPREDA